MARSFIGPKPVHKPHPPLYSAARSPGAMRRTARCANGWNPYGCPPRPHERDARRHPGDGQAIGRHNPALVVRAKLPPHPETLGRRPPDFVGSIDQIAEDVNAVEAIGASEVFFDVQFSPAVNTTADVLERIEQLWAATQ